MKVFGSHTVSIGGIDFNNLKGYFRDMEKYKPHFSLQTVTARVQAGKVRITVTAQKSASELGYYKGDICQVLLRLTGSDFYKSMTAYADSTTWQDVYRYKSNSGMLYVKLTIMEDLLVLSFKEL